MSRVGYECKMNSFDSRFNKGAVVTCASASPRGNNKTPPPLVSLSLPFGSSSSPEVLSLPVLLRTRPLSFVYSACGIPLGDAFFLIHGWSSSLLSGRRAFGSFTSSPLIMSRASTLTCAGK